MTTLRAHDDAVFTLVFSADDKRMFSGSIDGKVRVWETDKATARDMWHAQARREGQVR